MADYPDGFLWGAATAAHQVEGNNTNCDFWAMEFAPGTIFREPSGDACDHYRLYREDIRTMRELGFNAYRFSIEWARVEPADGFISRAALRHYADVLTACHEMEITPVVTLHHFTSPRWLMRLGGWESAETPGRFAAYCRAVMEELGSLVPYVCTINEANLPVLLAGIGFEGLQAPVGASGDGDTGAPWMDAAARDMGVTADQLKPFLFAAAERSRPTILDAHERGRDAVKSARADAQVGLTLALSDVQALPGGEARAERRVDETFRAYLPALSGDDFLGVQNYTRERIGPEGTLPTEADAESTQMGYEYYPEALEGVLRMAAEAGLPMIVTENGLATADDTRRVAFIERALAGVRRCQADGLDIRGYLYWSLLDNFEWVFGYEPTFGLIAVDRDTQERHIKESARFLGRIARGDARTA